MPVPSEEVKHEESDSEFLEDFELIEPENLKKKSF